MITPRKMLCPEVNKSWKFPYDMVAEFYVVHNTANNASANDEITYMNRTKAQGGKQVSYHYAIDDKEVVQGLEENVNGWHASDGANGAGNRKGIGIEICWSKSGGEKFIKAEKLTAEFIAQELKKKGWGLDRVKKHQDFDPNGKYCPHRTLDMGWQRFLNMIDSYMNPEPAPQPTPVVEGFGVGDVVDFLGGKHYTSANGSTGYNVTAGPAKITATSEGAKHPYHVVHTDSKSSVYGWVDASAIKVQEVAPTPAPQPTPAPTPAPENKPIEIVVGAVVQFKGGKHYTGANSDTGYNATAGQAKVTNISKGAKHPYHLVHTDNKSNVYGWVNASDIEGATLNTPTPTPVKPVVTEIQKGDTVYFKGGKNYVSSSGEIGYSRKAGYATVTNISKGKKYPYHLVRTKDGGSNVYGWVAADTIKR
jgi:hypothetical protein